MTDEQKPPRKPHLSPSSLEMYAKCGEQFRRRYIEGDKIPPGVSMLRGTGVHAGVEANMRQKIDTYRDLPVSDVVDAAVAKFDLELAGGYSLSPDETSRGATIVIGESRDTVATLAELAGEQLCPQYQPKFVEQAVRVELPDSSHDLFGVLDLADDQARVIDVKTSAKSMAQDAAEDSVALTAYSAFHKVLTGEFPAELRLEVLVNTKTPKRQTLVSQRDDRDLQALAARVERVTAGLQAGIFAPAPTGAWWCGAKWCGYHSTCPFVNPGRAAQGD